MYFAIAAVRPRQGVSGDAGTSKVAHYAVANLRCARRETEIVWCTSRERFVVKFSAAERVRGLRVLVGNTPLLVVEFAVDGGEPRRLYAKAENLNMTGSIKDRMALHILQRALESGQLQAGGMIIEATSGNTGISFCAIGRALGHPVTIFMPDWMSAERIALIRSFGANVRLVSKEEGGFLGSIRLAEELAANTPGSFLPRQFSNEANSDAHVRPTGPELWAQLQSENLVPAAFVAGVGTGGTIMGAGRFLRSVCPTIRLHPMEPSNSPTLSHAAACGAAGQCLLPGA